MLATVISSIPVEFITYLPVIFFTQDESILINISTCLFFGAEQFPAMVMITRLPSWLVS